MIRTITIMLAIANAPIEVQQCPCGQYEAIPVRVIDGDTLVLVVELGMDVLVRVRGRLRGVDTPEEHGPNRDPIRGPQATKLAQEWTYKHPQVCVEDHGPGKYARRRIVTVRPLGGGPSLSDEQKRAGNEK